MPNIKSFPLFYKLSPQGCIFPKIQPTAVCRIELTFDKNQAKTQGISHLSAAPIFKLSTLENPCIYTPCLALSVNFNFFTFLWIYLPNLEDNSLFL